MNTLKTAELEIQTENLLKASFIFEAAINPACQILLRFLDDEGRMTAKDMCQKTGMEMGVCGNYLSILSRAELVSIEKDNNQQFYEVNYALLEELYACAETLIE